MGTHWHQKIRVQYQKCLKQAQLLKQDQYRQKKLAHHQKLELESFNVNIAIEFARMQMVLHSTKGLILFTTASFVIRSSATPASFRSMLQSTTLTKQTMHSSVSTAPRAFLLTQQWNNMWNHPTTLTNLTCVSGVEGHSDIRLISQSISRFTNRSPMSVNCVAKSSHYPGISRDTSAGPTSANCVAKFSHYPGISRDTSAGPTSSEYHQKPLMNCDSQCCTVY